MMLAWGIAPLLQIPWSWWVPFYHWSFWLWNILQQPSFLPVTPQQPAITPSNTIDYVRYRFLERAPRNHLPFYRFLWSSTMPLKKVSKKPSWMSFTLSCHSLFHEPPHTHQTLWVPPSPNPWTSTCMRRMQTTLLNCCEWNNDESSSQQDSWKKRGCNQSLSCWASELFLSFLF